MYPPGGFVSTDGLGRDTQVVALAGEVCVAKETMPCHGGSDIKRTSLVHALNAGLMFVPMLAIQPSLLLTILPSVKYTGV